MDIAFVCAYCSTVGRRRAADVKRAISANAYLYCNLTCAGMARRAAPKAEAQRKAQKAEYDKHYRALNRNRLRQQKAAYFQATYDPKKAAIERKRRMPRHVEYCRQPAYREKKAEYDRKRRASEYGEYAEAFLLLQSVAQEVNERISRYEIYQEQGRLNKSTRRKRAAAAGAVAVG